MKTLTLDKLIEVIDNYITKGYDINTLKSDIIELNSFTPENKIDRLVEELRDKQNSLLENSPLYEYVKNLAWEAVRHSSILHQKYTHVKRAMIDEFIDLELGVKEPPSEYL